MSFIEGVGDEVVECFVGFFVILTIIAAWWTTNTRRENWQIRTVYLLDRRLRRRSQRNLTNHTHSATISESTLPVSNGESTAQEGGDNEEESAAAISDEKPPEPGTSAESGSPTANEQEQLNIIEVMDADTNVLRQRRVAFYENRRETLIESSLEESEETEVPPNEAREIKDNQEKPQETSGDSNSIRIKLKFINDDLKLVDGKLEEHLGDFKRRHFSDELSSNKRVRLIFNGQVLQRDSDTLQSYGFFDNCVVHCLVHQQRQSPSGDAENANNQVGQNFNPSGYSNNNNNNRGWDLSYVLIAMVSFSLGSAWYFRYQHPHLFTVTTTVALVIITGIFTVVSIGMYFPDPEPQPQVENVH